MDIAQHTIDAVCVCVCVCSATLLMLGYVLLDAAGGFSP